jgi:hypothetical protein
MTADDFEVDEMRFYVKVEEVGPESTGSGAKSR